MIDFATYADGKRTLVRTEPTMAAMKAWLGAEIEAGRIPPDSRCRPYRGAPEKGDGWAIERQPGHVEPDEDAALEIQHRFAAIQFRKTSQPREALRCEAEADQIARVGAKEFLRQKFRPMEQGPPVGVGLP